MKKVEAIETEMFKITIGDNGCHFGNYVPGDEWEESFYGTDLLEIAKQIAKSTYKQHSILPGNKPVQLERVKVLQYQDKIFDLEVIEEHNPYSKTLIFNMQTEMAEFHKHIKSDEVISIRKSLKDEYDQSVLKEKQVAEENKKRIHDEKEKAEYERLKAKYENVKTIVIGQ